MNLIDIFIESAQKRLNCSTLNDLAKKLNTSQASISNWKARNAYASFCGALIENNYVNELSQILADAAQSDAVQQRNVYSHNQKLQNILDDLLCFFGTDEALAQGLEIHLIDKILDRLSILHNKSIAKFLDNLIFIDGEPLRARPFLFLYYIFQIIKSNQDEIDKVENFKAFILKKINDFKIFSLINHPGFTIKIKNSISDLIDAKFSEDECRSLVQNSPTVINLLEKRMPNLIVKGHKKYFD